jgi:N-carbamoyl-L-amino-acid hydrolase
MVRAGIEPRNVFAARRDLSTLMGYIELHIEQGLRLERANTCIGAVTGIVGRATFKITFHGQAAHSGTTDMYRRRDALRGAALFITRAHELTRERYGDGIFNCGKLDVEPGAFNVIPSKATLTTEVRHVNARLLNEMETALLSLARECAASHALTVDIERIAGMPAADMDENVIRTIEQSCDQLGLSHMRLVSYSGHAAQMTSSAVPSGMIFIPSVDGISHNPKEFSRWDDVLNGANVLLRSIVDLAMNGVG